MRATLPDLSTGTLTVKTTTAAEADARRRSPAERFDEPIVAPAAADRVLRAEPAGRDHDDRAQVVDDVDGVLLDPGHVRQLTDCLMALERDRGRIDRFRSAIGPVRTMSDVAHDYIHLFERLCNHASAS